MATFASARLSGAIVGWGVFVAFLAAEFVADVRSSAGFGRDPRSVHPRRVVANVLVVAARKLRDPMLLVVDVVADDGLLH